MNYVRPNLFFAIIDLSLPGRIRLCNNGGGKVGGAKRTHVCPFSFPLLLVATKRQSQIGACKKKKKKKREGLRFGG